MKKVCLILCMLNMSVFGMAQSVSLGVRVGTNLNFFTNVSSSSGSSYSNDGVGVGFLGGAFVNVGIGGFYLQPELLYSQRSAKQSYTYTPGYGVTGTVTSTTTVSYLDVPISFGRNFFGGKFRISLGPTISFPFSSKVEVSGVSGSGEVSGLQSPQIAYLVGVGTNLGKFVIDLRYDGYLNDVSSKASGRYNGFQISVGYKFVKLGL
jgi:Outer membrane protein beta-barrel domain